MIKGSLTEKLAVYSMAAGGTMIAGQVAAATPGLPVTLNALNNDRFNVDVDGDGNFDYTIVTTTSEVNGFTYFCSYITTYGCCSGGTNYILGDFSVGGGYLADSIGEGVAVSAGDGDFYQGYGYITYCSTNGEQTNYGRGLLYLLFAQGGPVVKGEDEAKGVPGFELGYLDITREANILRIAGGESVPVEDESTELAGRLFNQVVPVGGAIPIALGVLAMGAQALRRRRKNNS